MSIVLSVEQKADLDWLYLVYTWEERDDTPDLFGSISNKLVATTAPQLQNMGLVSENPFEKGRYYITQAGADYLRKDVKITTPFDTDELTAARAEIARLTAALAASEAARKIADAGWSEAIDEVSNLVTEIAILKQDSGIPF